MDNQLIEDKPSKKGRLFILILISLLLLLLVICTTFSVLSLTNKINIINRNYSTIYNTDSINLYTNPDLVESKMEEAFLKSKLQLSENDSINLSINLKDSSLCLEIKGTSVYIIPITTIKRSKIFDNIEKSALINYFSTPFCVMQQQATFLKAPLIIKKAPKDTSEVEKNNVQADTILPEIVACRFYTDKGLIINIRQNENIEKISLYKHKFIYNLELSTLQLKKIIRLKTPDYIPWVYIEIDKKDAVSIYRALPDNTFISVQI